MKLSRRALLWVAVVSQMAGGLGVAWGKIENQGSAHMLGLLPFRDGLGEIPGLTPEASSGERPTEGPAAEILDPWAALPARLAPKLAGPSDSEPSDYPSVTEPARIYAPPIDGPSITELQLLRPPHEEHTSPPREAKAPPEPLAFIEPAIEIVNPWPEPPASHAGDPIRIVNPWAFEASAPH